MLPPPSGLKRTPNEKRIACEDHFLIPIFHHPTNTILRMTRRMQRFDRYSLPDLERLLMLGRLCDGFAILAANNR